MLFSVQKQDEAPVILVQFDTVSFSEQSACAVVQLTLNLAGSELYILRSEEKTSRVLVYTEHPEDLASDEPTVFIVRRVLNSPEVD